jgi:hypothetical protein
MVRPGAGRRKSTISLARTGSWRKEVFMKWVEKENVVVAKSW